MSTETTGWRSRFAALQAADGEEWDRLFQAIESDWKREYRDAFVKIALLRGWDRENAESWVSELEDEAFIDRRSCWPRRMAQDDVHACERETANV